jgi:hypothetical protein
MCASLAFSAKYQLSIVDLTGFINVQLSMLERVCHMLPLVETDVLDTLFISTKLASGQPKTKFASTISTPRFGTAADSATRS